MNFKMIGRAVALAVMLLGSSSLGGVATSADWANSILAAATP